MVRLGERPLGALPEFAAGGAGQLGGRELGEQRVEAFFGEFTGHRGRHEAPCRVAGGCCRRAQQVRGGQDVVNALGARPPASWTAVTRVAQSRKLIVAGVGTIASIRCNIRVSSRGGKDASHVSTASSSIPAASSRSTRSRGFQLLGIRIVGFGFGCGHLVCPFSLTSCPLNHRGEFLGTERRDERCRLPA